MLNLTTNSVNAIGLDDDCKMEGIGKAWNELHKVLTVACGDFEHYSLVTNEGNGVMHVVVVGLPFVYYKRLMRWWNYLYGSFCWISKIRGSAEGIAGYLFGQYLSNQSSTKVYGRMSNNWICKRFMSYWKTIRFWSSDFSKAHKSEHGLGYWYEINRDLLIRNFVRWLRFLVGFGYPVSFEELLRSQEIRQSLLDDF